MKLLPTSFRLSRKLVFVLAGVLVLSGASGAAAIFLGRDVLLGLSRAQVSGVACTAVTTVRLKQGGQSWLRKYVRSTAEDGVVRVKTALRVAGAISISEQADLYQVILLDDAGPVNRADMRGRAIGAEVLFSRNPADVPGMSVPFVARYVTGKPAANGEFYGERKELSLDEIKTIVTAMDERSDCADAVETAEAEGTPAEYAAAELSREVVSNAH